MFLRAKLERIGAVFFRWRPYFPLGVVVLLIVQKEYFYYFGKGYAADLLTEFICFSIALAGFAIRVFTVGYARAGTSGRDRISHVAENLNTDGIYSIVRNPLYTANFFFIAGISMLSENYKIVIINVLLFTCYYVPIILNEEAFLYQKFGEEFLQYAKRTPILMPNLKLWRKPRLRFNIVRTLYREHDGLMGIVTAFFVVELLREHAIHNKFYLDVHWAFIFLATFILWLFLKIFKKSLILIDKAP